VTAVIRIALLGLVLGAAAAPIGAQVTPRMRPAGVTDSAISRGKTLFYGAARCVRCHGLGGRGTPYGPDLADAIWWHGPGSYEWLAREVSHGIPSNLTVTGDPMPAGERLNLTDAEVHAVAAYVWAISHPSKPPLAHAPEPS
jgi:mono/diheme cytochrome c family protein